MKCRRSLIFIVICTSIISFTIRLSEAQEAKVEINAKAARYLKALERRPDSDTLFQRFFDSWLETGTLKGLETYLGYGSDTGAGKLLLANYYLRQGKDEQAAQWLKDLGSDDEVPARLRAIAWTSLGEIVAGDLDFKTALSHLAKAQEEVKAFEKPDRKQEDELAKLQGRFLIRAGDSEQGIAVWKEILERYPDDQILQEDVIELLSDEGFYDEAIDRQKGLLAGAKDAHQKVMNQIQLGKLYRKASRNDEAIDIWKSALPATGNDTWMEREILGLIEDPFRRKDDLKGWRTLIEQLIAVEPNRLALNIIHAELLAELREDKEALDAWVNILKLTPGDRDLRLKFVRTLARLGRPDDAAERMQELIKLDPVNPEIEFELAELQAAALQFDDAGTSLENYLEKSDGSEFAYLRTARQLDRFGLPTRAEAVFQKMISRYPDSAGAKDSFARFLYETEQKGRAIDLWKTLADEGDLRQLLNVSRQLSQRFENQIAFDLLNKRLPEFENDSTILAEICLLSLPLEKANEVFPLARHRVDLVSSTEELGSAIELAVKLAVRSDQIGEKLEMISADSNATMASRCLAAMLRNQVDGFSAAIDDLRKLVDVAKPDELVLPLTTIARLQKSEGWWSDAALTMEQVVAAPGGRKSSTIQELVDLFSRSSNTDAALKWAREWKKIAPGNPRPWLREASALSYRGKIEEALEVLRDASRRFERSTETHIQLARTYSTAGFPVEAERVLWKLYEDADDQWARRSWIDEMARLAHENGRLEELIENFKARQRNNSKSSDPLMSLAQIYQFVNRDEEYREALFSASRLDPDNILLIHRIASLDEMEGRFDSAIQLLEEVMPLDKSGRTSERLAQLHLSVGNLTKALALMEEMPSGRKPSADDLIEMVQTMAVIGEWDILTDFLEPKLSDYPDDPRIHFVYAASRYLSGNTEETKKVLLRLLSFEGSVVPAQQPNSPTPQTAVTDYPAEVDDLNLWMTQVAQMKRVANTWGKPGVVYSLAAQTHHGNSQPIYLPSRETEIRAFAAALLSKLPASEELDKEMLAAGLTRRKVGLMKLEASDSDEFKQFLAESPEDAALHFRWATNVTPDADKADLIFRAIELAEKKYGKEHAVYLAFQVASRWKDDSANELVKQGLKLASEMESISDILVTEIGKYCLQILGKDNGRVDPEVLALLSRWEMTATPKQPWGNHGALQVVLAVLGQSNQTDEWLNLVEKEIARYAAIEVPPVLIPPGASVPNMNFFFRRSTPDLPAVQKFPSRMPGVPPGFLLLLKGTGGNSHSSWLPIPQAALNVGGVPKGLNEKLSDYIDRPFLGALLARADSDEWAYREMVDRLRKLPLEKQTPAIRLLLAHEEYHERNFDESLAHFVAVRNESIDSETAKSIDIAILNLAKESDPDSSLREEGVKAAIRLRGAKSLDLRQEWPGASALLKRWGYQSLASAPLKKASQPVGLFHHRNANPLKANLKLVDLRSLQNRVEKLLERGKDEAVVRICASHLPLASGRILSVGGEHQKQQFFELIDRLQSKDGLTESIIEKCRDRGDRRIDQVRYAAVCDIIGNIEAAIEAYRTLLDVQPEDSTIRLRLLHLLTVTDPAEAVQQLAAIEANADSAQSFQQVLSSVSTAPMPIEAKLDFADILIEHIGKGSDSASDWIGQLTSSLQSHVSNPDWKPGTQSNPVFQIPSIFDSNLENSSYRPKIAGKNQERFDRIYQRRMTLFGKLCRLGIETTDSKDQYFDKLVRLKVVADQLNENEQNRAVLPKEELVSEQDLLSFAIQTLDAIDPENLNFYGGIQAPVLVFNGRQGGGIRSNAKTPVSMPLPWLVEYAFQNQQPKLVQDSAGSNRDRNPILAKNIDALGDLYFCEPAEFPERLAVFESVNPKGSERFLWPIVQRVMVARPGLTDHFEPDELIFAAAKSGPDSEIRNFARDRARAIAVSKEKDELEKFINRFIDSLIGTGDDRERLVKQRLPSLNTGGYQFGSVDRFRVLVDFFREISQYPETTFCAAKLSRELGISSSPGLRSYWRVFTGGVHFDKETLPLLLENSPLLGDIDEYLFLPAEDFANFSNSGHDLMVSSILHEIHEDFQRSGSKEDRTKLREQFNGDTFGAQMLRAMLSENADFEALQVFDQHVVELQDLPDDRRRLFGLLAARLINPKNLPPNLTRDDYDTLRWIGETSGEGEGAKMDKLIAARSIRDTGVEPNRFYYDVKEQISLAMRFDSDKSYQAFFNISKIGEEAVKKRTIRPPNSSVSSFTDPFISDLLRNGSPVTGYAFLNRFFHNESDSNLYIALPDFDESIVKAVRDAKSDDDRVGVIAGYAEKIYADLPEGGDTALAIPIFYQLLRSCSSSFLPELREWAKGRNGIAIMPNLARDIDVAAAIKQRSASEIKNTESLIYQRLKYALTSSDINPGLRFLVSGIVCDDYSIHSDEIIQICAENLASAWQETSAVNSYQARDIINALANRYLKLGPEEWQAKGWLASDEQLSEGFHRRFVNGPVKCQNSDLVTKMAHLHLRRGALAKANELYRKYEPEIRYPASIFTEMVRFGEFQTAGQILRTRTDKLIDSSTSGQYFDLQLASQVKPFLETLGNDQRLRWISQMILTGIYDPGSGKPRSPDWPDRKGRQLEIAKTFDYRIFPSPEQQERVLIKLIGNVDTEELLQPALIEIDRGKTLKVIAGNRDYNTRNRQIRLKNALLLSKLGKGDDASVYAYIKEYDELSSQEQSNNRSILDMVETAVRRYGGDRELAGKLTGLWQEVIKRKTYKTNYSDSYQDLGYLIACHLVAGTEDKLDAFFAGLSAETKKAFTYKLKNEARNVSSYVGTPMGSLPREERSRLIAKFEALDLPSLDVKSVAEEKVAKFMQAKTAGETKFSSSSFEQEVVKVMLAASSQKDRRAIYEHAIKLVAEVQKTEDGWGKNYDNGHSFATELVREFADEARSGTWDGVTMIADVLWNDTPANFTYTWSNIYYLNSGFKVMWTDALKDRSISDAFGHIIEALQSDLPIQDKQAVVDYSVFLPAFYEFCNVISETANVIEVVKAADRSDDLLSRQFAAAARLWLASRESAAAEVKPELWVNHIEDVFAASETQDQMRMTLARHCLFRADRNCPDSLRRMLTFKTAQLLDQEVPVNGWELMLLLREFNTLPRDDEWDKSARLYIKGWNHKNRNNHLSKERGIGFHPVTDAKLAMLETILKLGDREQLEAYLKTNEADLEHRSRGLLLMVKYGEFDRASEWVDRNYLKYSIGDHTTDRGKLDLRYDLDTHNQVQKFLNMLPPTEKRYLAAYALVSAPDLAPDLRLPHDLVRPTDRRMQDISDTYKKTEFTTDKAKQMAVLYAGKRWQSAGKLYKELGVYFKKQPIEKIPGIRSTSTVEKKVQPLASYAVASLLKGNSKPYVELATRLGNAPFSKRSTYRVRSLSTTGKTLINMAYGRPFTARPDQLLAFSEATNALLASIDEATQDSNWADLMIFQIALAVARADEGGIEDLEKWRQALDEQERDSLIKVFQGKRDLVTSRLVNILKLKTKTPVSAETRWALISSLLADPWFRESWAKHPDDPVLKHLLDTEVFTPGQVREKRQQLIDLWPRDGKAAREIDAWLDSVKN